MITKEILIYLFEKKDPSRKRNLYKMFQSIIDSDMSRELIVETINEKLGKSGLISIVDVKYCRSEFSKKIDAKPIMKNSFPAPNKPSNLKEIEKTILDYGIELSDPDDITTNQNILKSKHSYK